MEKCQDSWDWKTFADEIVGNPQKEEEFKKITCEALQHMKMWMPDEYYKSLYKMHVIVYGCHFDRETAEKAVEKMVNIDGTKGEHWKYEEVEEAAKKNGIEWVADLYYAMNMLYSDASKVLGSNASMYVEMAKALYFNDPDMVEGKLFKQWFALMREQ